MTPKQAAKLIESVIDSMNPETPPPPPDLIECTQCGHIQPIADCWRVHIKTEPYGCVCWPNCEHCHRPIEEPKATKYRSRGTPVRDEILNGRNPAGDARLIRDLTKPENEPTKRSPT